jgi:hypothetical protein
VYYLLEACFKELAPTWRKSQMTGIVHLGQRPVPAPLFVGSRTGPSMFPSPASPRSLFQAHPISSGKASTWLPNNQRLQEVGDSGWWGLNMAKKPDNQ